MRVGMCSTLTGSIAIVLMELQLAVRAVEDALVDRVIAGEDPATAVESIEAYVHADTFEEIHVAPEDRKGRSRTTDPFVMGAVVGFEPTTSSL